MDKEEQLHISYYTAKMIPGIGKPQMVCTLKWAADFFSCPNKSQKEPIEFS